MIDILAMFVTFWWQSWNYKEWNRSQHMTKPAEWHVRPVKTHWMPRLIWVFAERTCHFVGFVMRWLISFLWNLSTCKFWQITHELNPCPAEPGYTQPLQIVDPDQLASEEANWSGSAMFVIKYMNLYQNPESSNLIGWKLEVGVAS